MPQASLLMFSSLACIHTYIFKGIEHLPSSLLGGGAFYVTHTLLCYFTKMAPNMKANNSVIMKSTTAMTSLKLIMKQHCHASLSCTSFNFLNFMPVTVCSRKWWCLLLLHGLQHCVGGGVWSGWVLVDAWSVISHCCCRILLCWHIAASRARVSWHWCCCGCCSWLPGLWSGIVSWCSGTIWTLMVVFPHFLPGYLAAQEQHKCDKTTQKY